MTFRIYANLDALPSDVAALFDAAARDDVFVGRPWFNVLIATALPAGETPLIGVLSDAAGPLAAIALARRAKAERLRGCREIETLANFYSCAFAPVLRADAPRRDTAAQLGAAVAAGLAPYDLLDLHTLAADDAATQGLQDGVRRAGLAV